MRRGLISLLAVAGIALTGCSPGESRPEVTFYSHGDTARVAPVLFCNELGKQCSRPDQGNVGELGVPTDAPVQISVPEELSSAPWQVVFRYRGPDGKQVEERSTVFDPGKRHAYTLRVPGGGQVEHIEVQRYSAPVTITPSGGILFSIGGTWVLDTHPEDEPSNKA